MKIHKILTSLLLVSMCCTSVFAEGTVTEYLNDGKITLDGYIEMGAKDETVTLFVTDSSIDLTNESEWKTGNSTGLVYVGSTSVLEGGYYKFNFILNESGLYNAVIGSNGLESYETRIIEYINKDRNTQALQDFNGATDSDDIVSILESNLADLGVFSDLILNCNKNTVADCVIDYITNDTQTAYNSDDAERILEGAIMLTALNAGVVGDVDDYADSLGIDGNNLEKYYDSNLSDKITSDLKKETITDLNEYEKKLTDSIILNTVNYGDGSQIKIDVLTDFADYIGVSSGKATTAACNALIANGGVSSIAAIKTFLEGYQPSNNNNNNNNAGGGGGGGGDAAADTNDKKEEINVTIRIDTDYVEENVVVEADVFSDLGKATWAKDAIEDLYKRGIVSGRGDMTFAPTDNLLREEFATMIVKAFGVNAEEGEMHFEDVNADDWYYEYVRKACFADIIKGFAKETFGSGQNITKQDIAVMVVRAADVCDYDFAVETSAKEFVDNGSISSYAKEAVKKLSDAGIVSGDENYYFNPLKPATRAEAAKILHSVLVNVGIA